MGFAGGSLVQVLGAYKIIVGNEHVPRPLGGRAQLQPLRFQRVCTYDSRQRGRWCVHGWSTSALAQAMDAGALFVLAAIESTPDDEDSTGTIGVYGSR